MVADVADPSVRDAVNIGCVQKVEHCEIASYGTLCVRAEALGYSDALDSLKQNIDEETAADDTLSEIAELVNADAVAVEI